MGTYTEFHFRIKLSYDVPERVVTFFRDMFEYVNTPGLGAAPAAPDDHEFFGCERWKNLFFGYAYHEQQPSFKLMGRTWVLEMHGELKNYGSEIQHFAEWISPYVKKSRKKKPVYLGWAMREYSGYQNHYHVRGGYVYRPGKRGALPFTNREIGL